MKGRECQQITGHPENSLWGQSCETRFAVRSMRRSAPQKPFRGSGRKRPMLSSRTRGDRSPTNRKSREKEKGLSRPRGEVHWEKRKIVASKRKETSQKKVYELKEKEIATPRVIGTGKFCGYGGSGEWRKKNEKPQKTGGAIWKNKKELCLT